jgi:GT2 family glycosyltransferase
MTQPVISTIILNWNRAHLLEQTLASYMETISCSHELWIVDNASTDHSRDVIEAFIRQHPDTKVMWLETNEGGEAFNHVLPKVTGELVYLSENDQIHQPGWCEKPFWHSTPIHGWGSSACMRPCQPMPRHGSANR